MLTVIAKCGGEINSFVSLSQDEGYSLIGFNLNGFKLEKGKRYIVTLKDLEIGHMELMGTISRAVEV